MPLLARLVLTLALALTGVVALTSPVHASEKRYWNNDNIAGSYGYAGYARGGIQVEFLSRRAIDIEGFIEDMCPKDGESAYMQFYATVNGLRKTIYSGVADANGCGNGRRYFDPAPYKTPFKGNIINGFYAQVCTRNLENQAPARACVTESFDNWRVD